MARLRERATTSGVEDPLTPAHLELHTAPSSQRESRSGTKPRNTPRPEDFQVVSTVGHCWRMTHITRNSHSPSFLISSAVVLPAQV